MNLHYIQSNNLLQVISKPPISQKTLHHRRHNLHHTVACGSGSVVHCAVYGAGRRLYMNTAVDGELHVAVVGNLLRLLAGSSTLPHGLQTALGTCRDGLIAPQYHPECGGWGTSRRCAVDMDGFPCAEALSGSVGLPFHIAHPSSGQIGRAHV